MAGPYLWISCANRKEGPINLAMRSSFFLPNIDEEFFGTLKLRLDIEAQGASKFNIVRTEGVQRESLSQLANGFRAQIKLEQNWAGKVGHVTTQFLIQIDDRSYPFDLILGLDPANLQREQYEVMLRDIAYWIFFSLSTDVERPIGLGDRPETSLRPAVVLFELLQRQVIELSEILERIARSPQYKISKQYYPASKSKVKRFDSRSLRWEATHPERSQSQSLDFDTELSYAVSENRFLCFFLQTLHGRVSFLSQIVERTIQDIVDSLRKERQYPESSRVPELEQELSKAKKIMEGCEDSLGRIRTMQNIDFLRKVHFTPGQFRLNYSLALTQDFNYSRAFALYRQLGSEGIMKRLDWEIQFSEELASLGVKKTARIYEYWAFLSVYKVLQEMQFYPEDDESLEGLIKVDVLNPRFQSGQYIKLVGEDTVYSGLEVILYYDWSFGNSYGQKKYAPRPDITLEFRKHGRDKLRIALDAKYKSYEDRVEKKDIQQCEKYLRKIEECQGAFLLHVSPDHKNYGAFMKGSDGKWEPKAHRYGYIPLIPGPGGNLSSLRILIGMILVVKMGIELDICWACGSDDVEIETYCTWDGREKDKRVCQQCGNEWWINMCRREGHTPFPLFKGDISFQVKHKGCPQGKGNYFCPSCGKCLCGAHVSDVLE
jgi:hypothetical protein